MNMIDAVKSVFSKYVGFSGRARRSEYWYWTLATILASLALSIIELVVGLSEDGSGPLSGLLGLAIFLPGLAVTFRRLHDTGRSGWWIGGFYLAIFVFAIIAVGMASGMMVSGSQSEAAFAGLGVFSIIFVLGILIYAIVMLVFLCTDSSVGPNKYGPNPKDEGNYDVFE